MPVLIIDGRHNACKHHHAITVKFTYLLLAISAREQYNGSLRKHSSLAIPGIGAMDTFFAWSQKVPLIMLFAVSAVSVGAGDYLAKKWSLEPGWNSFAGALVCYLSSSFFYLQTLTRKGLVVSSVIWSIASIIAFLFVGLVIFHEKLTVLQLIGVSLGIISLLMLSR
jgi:multidrug transporter EmrE-like cation transporter